MKVTKEILEEVDKIKEDCLIQVTRCSETDTYFVDKGYDEKIYEQYTIPFLYSEYFDDIEDLKDKIISDIAEGRITEFKFIRE
jgi:hypothetical protein